jgi:hypothetical protein
MRFIRVHVSLQPRINNPFHDSKCGGESGREAVADRMVEVVAEEEIVTIDFVGRSEFEGDGVGRWRCRG